MIVLISRKSAIARGMCLVAQSCLTLCNPLDSSLPGSSVRGDSPGKNTGVGCHVLLQGIFPTQVPNPGLLHCKWILYHLSHQGSSLQEYWSEQPIPSPGDLPDPGIELGSPALQAVGLSICILEIERSQCEQTLQISYAYSHMYICGCAYIQAYKGRREGEVN